MESDEPVCANPECEWFKEQARFWPDIPRYEYFGRTFGVSLKLCPCCHRAVQLIKEKT